MKSISFNKVGGDKRLLEVPVCLFSFLLHAQVFFLTVGPVDLRQLVSGPLPDFCNFFTNSNCITNPLLHVIHSGPASLIRLTDTDALYQRCKNQMFQWPHE